MADQTADQFVDPTSAPGKGDVIVNSGSIDTTVVGTKPTSPFTASSSVNVLPDDSDPFGQSQYDFTQRVFPPDLGQNSKNANYMVINISVPNNSAYIGGINVNIPGQTATTQNLFTQFKDQQPGTIGNPLGSTPIGELSKVDALRQTYDTYYTSANGSALGYNGEFLPTYTRRIRESIALYTPNTLQFDTNNIYEDISLSALGSSVVSTSMGMINTALDTIPKLGAAASVAKKVLHGASNLAGDVIGGVKTGMKVMGAPINPRVEILFSNTIQRKFQYDFLFAPESASESNTVKEIIQTLRFHAAPEINNFTGQTTLLGGLAGFTWTPPSEFDITFYEKGTENLNIPRINTCVLTSISIDYAPSGVFATFSNGAPVSIRMQLQFQELEVVHKLRVTQGF